MNLLLDTHVALWWLADDPVLPDHLRTHISDNANLVAVSAVTVWEVAIKAALGKIEVDDTWLTALEADGIQQLPVTWHHAERVRHLPLLHRDPFDRMLIAQALEERFTLVTADRTIPEYQVDCLTMLR